ncbi:MAG TPA: hypothetical protein VMB50_11370 [Myxococcales bacterium]|nr:hypothetical protein [Myxococcales bacterium]
MTPRSRLTRWAALGGALALAACTSSGVASTNGGGTATAGQGSTGSAAGGASSSAGTTGRASSSGGRGGSSAGGGSTSAGRGSSTGNGASSTGAAATSSAGAGSSTGAGAGSTSGSGGGTGGYLGVLERGGGPMRNAVFQDAAFTQAAVSDANTGLHVDPNFTSATWNGPVYSQPLYFVDTATSKTMVIVTTDSNEIFAVDAATGAQIWSIAQFAPDVDPSTMYCGGIVSPIGDIGTATIDPVARVLYVAAAAVVAGAPNHEVFAFDLDDGSAVSGWPVDLEGLPMTLGNGTTGKFQSNWENERGSLLLLNGVLYVPYGGLWGDCGKYSGAVAAIPTGNPSATAIWATSAPSGSGIWGPSGVASDGTSVFISTGNTNDNPSYPTAWNNANSEAVIRLAAGTPPLFSGAATDYFAPSDPSQDWYTDDTEDADLGSSGVVLFDYPGSAAHPHLAFAIGKTGNAYLLDRDDLGGLSTGLSEISGQSSEVFGSMAAYTTATATYVVTLNGGTTNYNVSGDPPALGAGWQSGNGGNGSPIVSTSDGTNDYMVWVTDGNLTALDGDSGNQVAQVSIPDGYTKWVTPIIAQGALYLAGNNQLMKFDP